MGGEDIVFKARSTDGRRPYLSGEWKIDKNSFFGEHGVDIITLNDPILLTSGRTYTIEACVGVFLPTRWERSSQVVDLNSNDVYLPPPM